MPLHHYLRLRWSEGFATASDLPPGAIGAQLETYGARCLSESRGEFGMFGSEGFPGLGVVWTFVGEVYLKSTGRKALFQHSIAARSPLPADSPERLLARAFERLYGRDEAGHREATITALYGVLSQTTYEETSGDVRELFISAEDALGVAGPGALSVAAEVAAGILRRRPDLGDGGTNLPDVRAALEREAPARPSRPAPPLLEVGPAPVAEPPPYSAHEDFEETDPNSHRGGGERAEEEQEITAILPGVLSDAPEPEPTPEPEPIPDPQPEPTPNAKPERISSAPVGPAAPPGNSTAPQTHRSRPPPEPPPETRRRWAAPLAVAVAALAVLVGIVVRWARGPSPDPPETEVVAAQAVAPPVAPALAPAGCFQDQDRDGYAVGAGPPEPGRACAGPDAFKTGLDCDDADAAAYPGAAEQCDGRDSNCDGFPSNGASTPEPGSEDTCLKAQFDAASMKLSLAKDDGVVLVSIRVHPATSCDSVKVGHGAGRVAYGVPLSLKGGATNCALTARKTSSKAKTKSCGAPAFDPNALADDNDGKLDVAAQCCVTWGKDGVRCQAIAGGQQTIKVGL